MASNLTILLIPGAWHRAAIFDGLKERLSHSYPSLAINLPTCGSEPPVLDGNEDAAAIRHVVEDLASNEKEVNGVANMYSPSSTIFRLSWSVTAMVPYQQAKL